MNHIRRKYRMRGYARTNKIDRPKGFRPWVFGWGRPARTLLRRIQRHAGLKPTGAWNVEVQDLLFPPTFGRMVVRVARGELGVREDPPGSNSGPRVDVYLKNAGIPTTWDASRKAWCASGVKWVYDEARRRLGLKPIAWFWNPAGVPQWTAAAKAGALMRPVAFRFAAPGDFVCLWGSGHIEIVESREGDWLHCIGFNTSPVGQDANGGMVARTKRHRTEVDVVGRLK